MAIIPALSITLCQQGGIGYPPVLVRLNKWYYVSDSRERKPPELLEIEWQKRGMKFWHSQAWGLKRIDMPPSLTWNEILQLQKRRPRA